MTTLTVVSPGPHATVQDLGRPGLARLGVPRSGAADRGSLRRANRLVGNLETAAAVEVTLGGLHLRSDHEVLITVTGAETVVSVGGAPVGTDAAVVLPADTDLAVDTPRSGCRNYLAVRGGIGGTVVLGSRSTDALSGIGPRPLTAGTELAVADDSGAWPAATSAPPDRSHAVVVTLAATSGPRESLVDADRLYTGEWQVSPDSDRVGVRLQRADHSPDLEITAGADAGDLPSEPIAHGSVQVPPSGLPVIFLADHPVTGGYPVVAILGADTLDEAAQLVPGSRVRFRRR